MAMHVAIICNRCGTAHFVATSSGIRLPSLVGPYQLTCSCAARTHAHKNDMRMCRASDEAFARGYAKVGEYEVIDNGPIGGRAS